MKSVEAQVDQFLKKYSGRVIGGGWRWRIDTVAPKDMAIAVDGEPAAMSVNTFPGEAKLRIRINSEVDWAQQSLEMTVVHELCHAVCALLGFTTAQQGVQGELVACNPIAGHAFNMIEDRLFEEVLDRFATAIVG